MRFLLTLEQSLPSRYPYVVQDMLKYCDPQRGFWIDLGAGKGQVAIPLIEATDNPIVMLDPNAEALSKGLEIAREKGIEDRLSAVVGVAEDMPFPDDSVDFVASPKAFLCASFPDKRYTNGGVFSPCITLTMCSG